MRHITMLLPLLLAHCTILTGGFASICGDGFIQGPEETCDDGNKAGGDGCDDRCLIEAPGSCGDGSLDGAEECDDGNNTNGDGCNSACQVEGVCGDNILDVGEECEDGNTIDGDGCDAVCQIEDSVCGNNAIEAGEQCDDGNTNNGDGCDFICQLEGDCGNGIVEGSEECDDGNQADGDLCEANCTFPEIVEITAGDAHTCALTAFGNIKCWGDALNGQLGYGNPTDIGDSEAVSSVGFVNVGFAVDTLEAGGSHNCALNAGGELLCWGDGDSGRLGYASTIDIGNSTVPAGAGFVNFGANTVRQVSSGGAHTCVVLNNNAVQCWGDNFFGQLGYGDTIDIGDDETPLGAGAVDLNQQPALRVTTGSLHTCVLLNNGAVRCWGAGSFGRLGYGNENNIGDEATETTHDSDVALPGVAVAVVAGGAHTCALLNDASLHCWGKNNAGQLGLGSAADIGDNETPELLSEVSLNPRSAIQVALGGEHTCALLDDATVKCWGKNNAGQLGLGNTDNQGDSLTELPSLLPVVAVGGAVAQITAGAEHTCALLTNGSVRCWGNGNEGRLGHGDLVSIGDDESPESKGDVPLF